MKHHSIFEKKTTLIILIYNNIRVLGINKTELPFRNMLQQTKNLVKMLKKKC